MTVRTIHVSQVSLTPMTLVLKLDVDMIKMCHHTKKGVQKSVCTDRQTSRQGDSTKRLPSRMWAVIILNINLLKFYLILFLFTENQGDYGGSYHPGDG